MRLFADRSMRGGGDRPEMVWGRLPGKLGESGLLWSWVGDLRESGWLLSYAAGRSLDAGRNGSICGTAMGFGLLLVVGWSKLHVFQEVWP
jgi:hypothetical protein